jgi:hypothetical protein
MQQPSPRSEGEIAAELQRNGEGTLANLEAGDLSLQQAGREVRGAILGALRENARSGRPLA